MLNYMLGRTLQQFVAEPLVIVGLGLIAFGIALGFLSRRITRAVRNDNNISSQDKVFIGLKLTAMLFIVAGFVCIAVNIITYLVNR